VTSLLDAIQGFSARSLRRYEVPEVAKLKTACARFQPSNSRTVEAHAKRLKSLLEQLRGGDTHSITRRDTRFVLAAAGKSAEITPDDLSLVITELEHRNEEGLYRAAFGSLLATHEYKEFSDILRPFLKRHIDAVRFGTRLFASQSQILESDDVTPFAQRLIDSKSLQGFCLDCGISTNVLASNYGIALKLATLRLAVESDNVNLLRTVSDWAYSGIAGTPAGAFYEAMLEGFASEAPVLPVRKLIVSVLVGKFGDPRLVPWPGLTGPNGEKRRERCVSIVRRWLSIEYLDLFIKIIEDTAEDRQFKPRKAFWLKYFEAGVVSDVTLVLASDASRIARRMRAELDNGQYMQWAALSNSLPNQSVLLLKVGDLIIAEWSHSGAMRFWNARARNAPCFHERDYLGSTLRNGSIKIKVGNEYRESIIHHENGQWMKWAEQAITYHTGISI
jgi:EH_Signature domain